MSSKYSGPLDIYKELVDESPEDQEWLLGLVAFAVVEEQKIEWMKHHSDNGGKLPSDKEVSGWYKQQASGVLLRAKDTAEARLTGYAADAISTYTDDREQEIRDEIIVQEIRDIKKFWPQFGVSFAGGFTGAILFAALLTLIAFFVKYDTSPVQIVSEIGTHNKELNHAEKE